MNQPIASFTNEETQMKSYVWPSDRGGFNVTLQDLDSGEFVPAAIIGIQTQEKAIAKARRAVGMAVEDK